MLATNLREILLMHRIKNKPLTAILLSDTSFKELEDDVQSCLVYPAHGGQIMYLYGVAIIRKKETVVEDKND